MNAKQVQRFRRRLEEKRRDAQRRLAEDRERSQEPVLDVDPSDAADDAVRDVLVDTALQSIEARARELEEIDDALARLDAGSYGICEICGKPIELERLEALPATRLCLQDAKRSEVAKAPTL